MRRLLCVLVCLLLVPLVVSAQPTPVIEIEVRTEEIARNGGTLSYPQIIHPDAAVQDAINNSILEKGRIADHTATLATLTEGGTSLTVTSQAALYPETGVPSVLTVLMEAHGRMPAGRPGSMMEPMMFRLSDGALISGESVFLDRNAAQEVIDAYIDEHIVPDLSVYLDPFMLTPAPLERLVADKTGVTIYYPAEEFTSLSGRGVAIHLAFHELPELWDFEAGHTLALMGLAADAWMLQPESAQNIANSVSEGLLPGLPVQLGEAVQPLADRFGQPLDTEYFPAGEKHYLEDAIFRQTYVISDADNAQDAVVTGIVSQRLGLYGLLPGVTTRNACEETLGVPFTTLPMDAGTAEAYGFSEGELLTYLFGQNSLMLAFGYDQVLTAIYLSAGQP